MTLTDRCRLCAEQVAQRVSVFGEHGHNIEHKLRTCSPVQVRPSDTLPQHICLCCLSQLDQTYEFYQKVKEAQLFLKAADKEQSRKRQLSECNESTAKKFQFEFGTTTLSSLTKPIDDLYDRKCSGTSLLEVRKFPPPSLVNVKTDSVGLVPPGNPSPAKNIPGETPSVTESTATTATVAQPAVKPSLAQPSVKPLAAQPSVKPSVTQPSVKPSVAQPPVKPSVAQPPVKPSVAQPPVKPSVAQPPVKPSVTQPSVKPSVAQPSVKSSVAQPSVKPSVPQLSVKPSAAQPSVTQPSVTPPAVKECSKLKLKLKTEPKSPVKTYSRSPSKQADSSSDDMFKSCKYCDRRFLLDDYLSHEALHKGGIVFICDQCNKSFFTDLAYQRHVARHLSRNTVNQDAQ